MSDHFMKTPCKDCPFRIDKRPFLHPERAYEIASHASNPYNSFPCHKTTESVDVDDGGTDRVCAEASKECAGFLTMRATESERGLPDGFEPSFKLVYESSHSMEHYYQEQEDGDWEPPEEGEWR